MADPYTDFQKRMFDVERAKEQAQPGYRDPYTKADLPKTAIPEQLPEYPVYTEEPGSFFTGEPLDVNRIMDQEFNVPTATTQKKMRDYEDVMRRQDVNYMLDEAFVEEPGALEQTGRLAEEIAIGVGQGVADFPRSAKVSAMARDVEELPASELLKTTAERKEVGEWWRKFREKEGTNPSSEQIETKKQEVAERRRQAQIVNNQKLIDAFPESKGRVFEGGVMMVVEDATTGLARSMPIMVSASVNPLLGFGVAAAQMHGQKADELLKEGYSPEVANEAAKMYAAPAALLETAGAVFGIRAFKTVFGKAGSGLGMSAVAKKKIGAVMQNMIAEGTEEMLQEEWDVLVGVYAKNPDATVESIFNEAKEIWASPEQMRKVMYAGTVGSVGGVIPGGAAFAARQAAVLPLKAADKAIAYKNRVTTVTDEDYDLIRQGQITAPELQKKYKGRADIQGLIDRLYQEYTPPEQDVGVIPEQGPTEDEIASFYGLDSQELFDDVFLEEETPAGPEPGSGLDLESRARELLQRKNKKEPTDEEVVKLAERLNRLQQPELTGVDAEVMESVEVRAAAIRAEDGTIYEAPSHFQALEKQIEAEGIDMEDVIIDEEAEGFVTSDGRFVSREEAREIVEMADQLKVEPEYPDTVASEEIWLEDEGVMEQAEFKKYPIADRGEWYADADYKKRGGKQISMSPDLFLKNASPLKMDEEVRDNVDDLKRHITEGGTLDPAVFYLTDQKIVPKSHDGRHRAIAAKELGISEIPVLLIDESGAPAVTPESLKPARKEFVSAKAAEREKVRGVKKEVTKESVAADRAKVAEIEKRFGIKPVKESIEPAKKEIGQAERAAIKKQYGEMPETVEPSKESDKLIAGFHAIAKPKKKLHFFKKVGRFLHIAGFHVGNEAYIADTADVGWHTYSHETFHDLKSELGDLYKSMVKLVKPMVNVKLFKNYKKALNDFRESRGLAGLSNDQMMEEYLATYMGTAANTKVFWKRVFSHDYALFDALGERVMKILKTAGKHKNDAAASKMFSNHSAVLDALSDGYKEYWSDAGLYAEPGVPLNKVAAAQAGYATESLSYSFDKVTIANMLKGKKLKKDTLDILNLLGEAGSVDDMLMAQLAAQKYTPKSVMEDKEKKFKKSGGKGRAKEFYIKAKAAYESTLKMSRKEVAEKMTRDERPSFINITIALKNNPKLKAAIKKLGKAAKVEFFDTNGAFKHHPIEERTKPDPDKVFKLLPKFGGFRRSVAQTMIDEMAMDRREAFRKDLVKWVEASYKDGTDPKSFDRKLENIQNNEYRITSAVRVAHKTLGAINLNSMCPMFNVGNHGCYLDGCYITGMGAGGNGMNFYNTALYSGEILQMSQEAIDKFNKVGGLRINGAGDTSMEHLPQMKDVFKHAGMRGLKLKWISKQESAFKIIDALQKEKDPNIKKTALATVIQPTVDPYWVPVTEDDMKGSAVDVLELAKAAKAGKTDAVIAAYKEVTGRDAKVIDGQVMRKYGFSFDQLADMSKKYKKVKVQPRLVIGTFKEITEYALKAPEFIQTWMHAKVRPGMYSEINGKMLEAGEVGNFTYRMKMVKGPFGYEIKATNAKGKVIEEAKVYDDLTKYINDNFSPQDRVKIMTNLFGMTKKDSSALCCRAGASNDACNDCTSHCMQGTSYTGTRLNGLAKTAESMADFANNPPPTVTEMVEAYHGTSVKFDKFKTEKIGTGEGSQTFGWGLYFTSKKEIAKDYAKRQAKESNTLEIDGQVINGADDLARYYPDIAKHVGWSEMVLAAQDNAPELAAETYEEYAENTAGSEEVKQAWLAAAKLFQEDLVSMASEGRVYTVSVHKGKSPDEYEWLDWSDQVTSDQWSEIQEYLAEDDILTEVDDAMDRGEGIAPQGQDLYEALTVVTGSPKEASLFLLKAGIDGVRYPAGTIHKGSYVKYLFKGKKVDPMVEYIAELASDKAIPNKEFESHLKSEVIAFENHPHSKDYVDVVALLKGAKRSDFTKEVTYNYVVFDEAAIEIEVMEMAEITPKQIELALSEADMPKDSELAKVKMEPEDYLNLTTGTDKVKDRIVETASDELDVAKLAKKNAILLVVDKSGKVIGHDGRHRSASYWYNGTEFVNVLLIAKPGVDIGKIKSVKSQKFGENDRGLSVDIKAMPVEAAPEVMEMTEAPSIMESYEGVPDNLMGFGIRESKGFEDQAYSYVIDVEVTFPKSGVFPENKFVDSIKGLNKEHAMERARRNWETSNIKFIKGYKEIEFVSESVDMPDDVAKVLNEKIGVEKKPIKQKVVEVIDDFWENKTTRTVDRLHPIKEKLGGEAAPYMLHRGLPGVQSTLNAFMIHGKLTMRDDGVMTTSTTKQGFLKWVKDMGADAEKMFYWIMAKRAETLEKEGREHWLTPDVRKIILDWVGDPKGKKSWEQINKEFQEWNQSVLDIAIQAGLLTKSQISEWQRDFYIPFYRVFENQEANAEYVKGPAKGKINLSARVMRLKGAEEKLGDPFENVIRNWSHLVNESMSNVARASAYNFAVNNEIPSGLTAIDDDGLEESVPMVEDAKWSDTVLFKTQKGTKATFIEKKTGSEVLSFKDKGKTKFFKVNDPELFQALSMVNKEYLNGFLMRVMSGTKRVLTAGATFGPAFRIANMIRDTLHTFQITDKFTFKPFIDTARGFVSAWRQDQDFVDFMASGHAFGGSYVRADDPQAMGKYIKKLAKEHNQSFKSVAATMLDTPKKLLDFWERVGSASENAARVQLYKNLKQKGKTDLEAAFSARDLMDFQMSGNGDVVGFLIATVPFLNARMQGLYRMGRAAVENPKVFFAKGAMITAATMLLWGLNHDDDRYKALENWEKFSYYHFWIGDTHFRIPKPFETGAFFSTMFEASADVAVGNDDGKHLMEAVIHTMGETFAFNPIPQAVRPAAEQWANKSFFTGRPIESQYQQKLKRGDRYDPWTSPTLILAGKMGIPPKRAEALIRGYFADIGMSLLWGADLFSRAFADFPEKPKKRIDEYPMIGRFVRQAKAKRSTKYMSKFWDFMKEVDELVTTINMYKKSGDFEGARKLADADPELISYRPFMNKARQRLRKMSHQVKKIWNDQAMTAEQKKIEIDKIYETRNALVEKIYNSYLKDL